MSPPERKTVVLKDGGVAQLGEHLPCKQGVDSSILFISTNKARKFVFVRNECKFRDFIVPKKKQLEN